MLCWSSSLNRWIRILYRPDVCQTRKKMLEILLETVDKIVRVESCFNVDKCYPYVGVTNDGSDCS